MFKAAKYITYCFLVVVMAAGLSACKSKKTIAASVHKPGAGSDEAQARFGYMYVNACTERMKGNLQEALKLFQECKKLDPSSSAAAYELGMINKLLGNYTEALDNAQFAAAAEPGNEWYQLLLIDCYTTTKQFAKAIKIREALVKNFPAKSEFKEDLAIEYAMAGQYEKSLNIYKELERTYGINEQITLNKVKLLKSQKKTKDAENELLKLLESGRSEPRYYSYLAEFYTELNEQEKAKVMYDSILVLEPNNPTIHLALHDYYSAKGRNAEAFGHLRSAFQNPDLDVRAKSNIVETFYKRAQAGSASDYEQGLELARLMLATHPKAAETNAIYADFLLMDKKFREAATYYFIAATNERRDFRVWQSLLMLDNELAQYDSLEHHSAQAIDYFPSQPEFYLYNGIAHAQRGDYAGAARALQDGIGFVVDNKAVMLDFLRSLGDAYFNLREYQKSDKAFDDALKIDADNTYVLNNYAYYLSLRNENLEKAEKFSKRTNELQPNNRSYMDTYGWILFQQKKYKEAEDWLSKAAKAGQRNPTILEHYGDVLFRLNRVDEAMTQWNAAKQAGGSSGELLKKIKEKKLDD